MKKALVCGAGGFIGGHLVSRLKAEGYWVRGVDLKEPEFASSEADEFLVLDLRRDQDCASALDVGTDRFDDVYQLAADMGGMGFISFAETEILRNNALINIGMLTGAAERHVPRYFFSSSVCVYRDMQPGEAALAESDAYPAMPDNEYGWEKLYAERMAMAVARRTDMAVRIARFQNCYGPLGTWRGGREKAPAAICRKVAEANENAEIEVWGDGSAVRSYIYVDDIVDGIFRLTQSELSGPANIGSDEYVTVDELVGIVSTVAGKRVRMKHVDGPVGVQARNFSHDRMKSLGWKATYSLAQGVGRTYPWVAQQVHDHQLSRTQ